MTEVLENVKEFIETEENSTSYQTPKIDAIFILFKLKRIAKKAEDDINQYVEKNPKIRKGQPVLKGTRITTKELLLILNEYSKQEEKDITKYITSQYPSIDSSEKIYYGLLYEISKINTINYTIRVLTKK